MKELPKDFRTKHGLQMLCISLKFFPREGLIVSRTQSTVSNTEHTCPAPTCDFILGGSSCTSENVFELHGVRKIIPGLTIKRPHTTFFYCLPENEAAAMEVAKAAMKVLVEETILELLCVAGAMREACDIDFGE